MKSGVQWGVVEVDPQTGNEKIIQESLQETQHGAEIWRNAHVAGLERAGWIRKGNTGPDAIIRALQSADGERDVWLVIFRQRRG